MKFSFIFVLAFVWGNAAWGLSNQNATGDITVKQWENLEKVVRHVIESVLKQALPTLIRASSDAGLSSKCSSSMLKFILSLRQMKTWAFEMLDAAGKPGGGIMEGTLIAFGSYDQCLNIVARDRPDSKEHFRGKYCTVGIHPPVPPKPSFYTMHHKFPSFQNFTSSKTFIRKFTSDIHFFLFLSYRLGVCIPSTCTAEDLNKALLSILDSFDGVKASVVNCEVKEPVILNKTQVGVLFMIGLLTLIVIGATGLHMFYRSYKPDYRMSLPYGPGYFLSIFLAFSLYRSMKRLMKKASALRQCQAVHGMRALSLFWIIFGHIFLYSNYQVIRQLKMAVDYSSTPLFQVLVSSPLGFDTFFFLTGFTLAHGIGKSPERAKVTLYLRNALHYILRIFPAYAVVIALVFVVPLTNSGPSWRENLDPVVDGCRTSWWSNLLFVNNFNVAGTEKCLSNSWYVACEFQLYILGLIVTALMGWTQIGAMINVLLIILSICITGVLTAYLKLPPTILFSQVDINQRQEVESLLFHKPYPHIAPFCLGLALGQVLSVRPTVKVKIFPKIMGWLLSIVCMFSVAFGIYQWNFEEQIATTATTIYGAAHRVAWTVGIAWVTFLCTTQNAGIVSSILSWTPFQAISRLSLTAYLFYPIVLTTLTSHLRERIQITPYVIVFVLCGISCLSLALSFLCYVGVVAPSLEIESMLFGRKMVVVDKKRLYEKSVRIAKKLKEIEAEGHYDIEKTKGEWTARKSDGSSDLDTNKSSGCVVLHL